MVKMDYNEDDVVYNKWDNQVMVKTQGDLILYCLS